MSALAEWDVRLFEKINGEWIHPWLDAAMPVITDFDHWRLPLVALLLVLLARGRAKTRVSILFAIVAVALADQIVSSGLKPVFERPRPFKELEAARKLVGAHDWSFPSAHAANSFAAGTFLAMRFRRLRWILVVPAVVAYSRVYVGVHYPLDVIAGAVVGGGVGGALALLERASRVRLERWLSFGKKRKRKRKAKPPPEAEPQGPADTGSA